MGGLLKGLGEHKEQTIRKKMILKPIYTRSFISGESDKIKFSREGIKLDGYLLDKSCK